MTPNPSQPRTTLGSIAAAAALALAPFAGAQVTLSPLVFDGGPVPGLAPAYSASPDGNPRIGTSGVLLIPVELTGPGIVSGENSTVLFTGSSSSLFAVAAGGMAIPGAPPGSIVSIQSTSSSPSDSGASIVSITLTDPNTFDSTSAFWLGSRSAAPTTPATPLRLYGAGDTAPAPMAPATISSTSFPSLSTTNRFAGFVVVSGGGTTSINNQAILTGISGQLPSIAARHGDSAPGIPANEPGGPAFLYLRDQDNLNFNPSGQILFRVALVNSSGSGLPFNPSAIYRYEPGAPLTLVAREGNSSGSGTINFGAQVPGESISMNAAGTLAFQTQQGNGTGNFIIWSGIPGSLQPAARSGTQAPSLPTGVLFTTTNGFSNTFSGIRIANTNALVFITSLSGTGVTASNNSAVFTGLPGALRGIARTGDPAPGAPVGAVFTSFASVAINAGGHALFTASDSLTGGTPGIWAQDRNGAVRKIVRNGDALTIGGISRTVNTVYSPATGTGADGLPSSFSAGGSLVVQAGFTDGTRAMLLARLGLISDFNGNGVITVQDIFDFLNAWFSGSPVADINGGGLSVQDIFDFLNDWFAGI